MIRVVAIGALGTLLLLVLYLPSAHPPERFIERLRHEHRQAVDLWGSTTGERILDRAMDLSATTAEAAPIPARGIANQHPRHTGQVKDEMDHVNRRLFDNAYFRSIDALLVLAMYRLSATGEWLAKGILLALALVADAAMERAVKAREFRQHDPEMFALYLSAAIVAGCALVLCLVLPWPIHPLTWAMVPLGMAFLAARAIADFHRRP